MFPQVFGKYVLEREIAAGGMARVYLATLRGAVGFEKRLVVKQIRPELASDPEFVRRFVEEAKTAVELSHPNIVPVYELGVEQGTYYIAMEYCAGVTLSEFLSVEGRLSPEEGAYVGVEICRALDYAHRRAGIVHRDVTPRNVIINDEGAIRLIDFGIAAPAGESSAPTSAGQVFGSPGHMPPEQLAGRQLGPTTDVFAVGALLIEAWTGRAPFRRATVEDCRRALAEVPRAIDADDARLAPLGMIIASAVAAVPWLRPESAERLASPLRAFLKSVDLGQLERQLGARVSRARSALDAARASSGDSEQRARDAAAPPSGSSDGVRPRSSGASIDTTTATFALRDDLRIWTRKLPDVAPASGPEERRGVDRKLGSGGRAQANEPAGLVLQAQGAAREPKNTRRAPRPSKYVYAGWLSSMIAAGALAAVLVRAHGPTELTRTTARARALEPASEGAPGRASASAGSAKAVALEARIQPAPERAQVRAAGGTVPSDAASNSHEPLHSETGGRSHVVNAEPAGSAASRKFAGCKLVLTSEPSSTVKIAGRVARTPLALDALDPGTYQVEFQEATLNEKLIGTVQLKPGDERRLHADFTAASPRLY